MAALSLVLPMGVGNGNLSTYQHSYFPRPRTLSGSRSFSGFLSSRGASGVNFGVGQESVDDLVKKSKSELGSAAYQRISDVTFVNLLEWIQAERLTSLPHKGSRWDRVLIRALYFAERLHEFNIAIQGFAVDSSNAVKLGFGHTQLLLEVYLLLMIHISSPHILTWESSVVTTRKLLTKFSLFCTSSAYLYLQFYAGLSCL